MLQTGNYDAREKKYIAGNFESWLEKNLWSFLTPAVPRPSMHLSCPKFSSTPLVLAPPTQATHIPSIKGRAGGTAYAFGFPRNAPNRNIPIL